MSKTDDVGVRLAEAADRDKIWPLARAFATTYELDQGRYNASFQQLVAEPNALLIIAHTPDRHRRLPAGLHPPDIPCQRSRHLDRRGDGRRGSSAAEASDTTSWSLPRTGAHPKERPTSPSRLEGHPTSTSPSDTPNRPPTSASSSEPADKQALGPVLRRHKCDLAGCGKLLRPHWPPATAESPSERRRKPMKSPIVRSSDNLLTVLELHG